MFVEYSDQFWKIIPLAVSSKKQSRLIKRGLACIKGSDFSSGNARMADAAVGVSGTLVDMLASTLTTLPHGTHAMHFHGSDEHAKAHYVKVKRNLKGDYQMSHVFNCPVNAASMKSVVRVATAELAVGRALDWMGTGCRVDVVHGRRKVADARWAETV
jgi:hypothetical protein